MSKCMQSKGRWTDGPTERCVESRAGDEKCPLVFREADAKLLHAKLAAT